MSAVILILAVVVVGACLWRTVKAAARMEFPQAESIQRQFVTATMLSFASFVGLQLVIGYSDVLKMFDRVPPPLLLYFLFNLMVCFVFAFSRIGTLIVKHTSIRSLIGFQMFRFLAELVLLVALHEGLAPIQLTLEGYNYDIVTALFAMALYFYLPHPPNRSLVYAFNFVGIGFLAIIAFIALTSMPTQLRLFMNEPSNIWVTGNPYILLPGILVVAAVTGHVLLFRKLALTRTLPSPTS